MQSTGTTPASCPPSCRLGGGPPTTPEDVVLERIGRPGSPRRRRFLDGGYMEGSACLGPGMLVLLLPRVSIMCTVGPSLEDVRSYQHSGEA